jgi:monoamine oxidase
MADAELTADVVIIGAGAAGLAALDHLRERGVSAVVLEARARIGGRIEMWTAPDGRPFGVGARCGVAACTHARTPTDRTAGSMACATTRSRSWRQRPVCST